jgi:hypothetical protein
MKNTIKTRQPKKVTQVTAFYGDRNQQSLTLPVSLPFEEKIRRLRKRFPSIVRAEIDGEFYTFSKRKVTLIPTVVEVEA